MFLWITLYLSPNSIDYAHLEASVVKMDWSKIVEGKIVIILEANKCLVVEFIVDGGEVNYEM